MYTKLHTEIEKAYKIGGFRPLHVGSSPIFRIMQESPEIQGKLINPRVSGFLLLKYFSRFWVKIPHFVYIVYTKVHTTAHAC